MPSVSMRLEADIIMCLRTYADAPGDQGLCRREENMNAYISLEERMACGIGACLGMCLQDKRKRCTQSNVNNKQNL